jgi:nucleotide-binding universal stress UspA family protein
MAITKILSPTDFSVTANAAMKHAESLALATGAEIVLLHVLHEPVFAFSEGAGFAPPTLTETYDAAMKKKLDTEADMLRSQGARVSVKFARGTPHEAIVQTAEDEHADLIVMGTHGRKGLSHLLLGSVAERVVRTSKRAVMTVRTP